MKIYYKLVLLIALAIIDLGVLLPKAISSTYDEILYGGILIIVLTLPIFYFLGKNIVDDITKIFKGGD